MKNWRPSENLGTIESGALSKRMVPAEAVGLADFPAGTYPACQVHGAMLRVAQTPRWYRCIACGASCEWTPDSADLSLCEPEQNQ